MLLLQHEAGKQNWVRNVKAVLVENGFGILWLWQSVGSETDFIAEFIDMLICCYIRRCKVTINVDGFIHSNARTKLKNI